MHQLTPKRGRERAKLPRGRRVDLARVVTVQEGGVSADEDVVGVRGVERHSADAPATGLLEQGHATATAAATAAAAAATAPAGEGGPEVEGQDNSILAC